MDIYPYIYIYIYIYAPPGIEHSREGITGYHSRNPNLLK